MMSLNRRTVTSCFMLFAVIAFIASGFFENDRKIYLLLGLGFAAIGLIAVIKDFKSGVFAFLMLAFIALVIYIGYPNILSS